MADIVLCASVLEREAIEQSKTLTQHLSHLALHGLLHALGYDHETSDAQAQEMETLEKHLLMQLGFENPYSYTNLFKQEGLLTK